MGLTKITMFVLAAALLIGYLIYNLGIFSDKTADYPELIEFKSKQLASFAELSDYFKKLAGKSGAPYAFEVLKRAPIPPGTDMHLLGHVVGDILYEQEGIEGIRVCTEDFRNACSHSIVVGLFTDKGESALPQITDACRKAPGRSGAYTMCFHGLGHGILAALGYDLIKTIEVCKKTGGSETNQGEYSQCVSGAVMEIIGGGFHDRHIWEKQRPKYLSLKDPLRLCAADFMPAEVKPLCYVYLTPLIFEAAGADLGRPTPADFEKAFPFCDKIPASEFINRDACFGGFGKEFIVLAQDRDIRKIDQMNEEQLKKVYEWCLLTKNKEGSAACVTHAVQSLYWGGENDRNAAIKFCGLIPEDYFQGSCFINLIGAVHYYIKDQEYITEFCGELPPQFEGQCRHWKGQPNENKDHQ